MRWEEASWKGLPSLPSLQRCWAGVWGAEQQAAGEPRPRSVSSGGTALPLGVACGTFSHLPGLRFPTRETGGAEPDFCGLVSGQSRQEEGVWEVDGLK